MKTYRISDEIKAAFRGRYLSRGEQWHILLLQSGAYAEPWPVAPDSPSIRQLLDVTKDTGEPDELVGVILTRGADLDQGGGEYLRLDILPAGDMPESVGHFSPPVAFVDQWRQ